jgi:hypothetical protein
LKEKAMAARRILMSLALVFSILAPLPEAEAAVTSTSVSASMQAVDQNITPSFTSLAMTDTGATAANVDLNPAGTPIQVHSSMTFNSVAAESAVFAFSIGMHGNGYPGVARLGALGDNKGVLHYDAAAPMTATVVYDYDIGSAGTNIYGTLFTFGMGAISMNGPLQSHVLPGTSPTQIAGHYHSEETFDLSAGDNSFAVSFGPNVSGPISWIDGQFQGTVTFIFGSAPVPTLSDPARLLLVTITVVAGVIALARSRPRWA